MEKVLEDLKMQLKKELEKITAKNDISPQELENATKAVCLMKKIQEIEEGMMDSEGGYSYGSSYDGYSGRRGRSPRTGQYVSRNDGAYNNGSNGYSNRSYDNGRSNHSIKDRMIDRLEQMMDEAGSEYERNEIGRWIGRLEME